MSLAKSKTVCSGIEWNSMLGLLVRLKKDNKIIPYLLIGTGAYLGLRAKDLLNIRWIDILGKDEITITESKTGKVRSITVNESLKEVLKYSSTKLSLTGRFKIENYLFANRKGQKFSIQYANRLLKSTLKTYGIKTQNASTHTLRKTFGKRVWEMDGQSERSLVYLSQIFNHSNVGITRRYIGIVQEDIRNIYLNL
jgi:integrase